MTDSAGWDNDILGEDATDEGLIELTDVVEDKAEAEEDSVIELTEIVEDEPEALDLDLDEDTGFEDDLLDEPAALSEDGLELETEDDAFGFETEDDEPEFEPDYAEPGLEMGTDDEEVGLDEEEPGFDGDELNLDGPESAEEADEDTDEVLMSLAQPGSSVEPEVSMEDIEAALERVIEKKFSDKIETILFEVVERMIEKEIAQIKASLQKDLDQIENG